MSIRAGGPAANSADRARAPLHQVLGQAAGWVWLWVSDVEPGSAHDMTAARRQAFPALYAADATLTAGITTRVSAG